MKKIFIFIIFAIILPFNVHAFTFNCDKNSVKVYENFNCTVMSDSNDYVETFEGYAEVNSNVNCAIDKENSLKLVSFEDKYFVFNGTPKGKKVLTFSCNVINKPSSPVDDTFKINYIYEDSAGNLSMSTLLTKYTISNEENVKPTEKVEIPAQKPEPTTQVPVEPTTEVVTTTLPIVTTKPRANEEELLLKSLNIKNVLINFSKYTYTYNLEVENKVDSVAIDAVPYTITSSYEIIGDTNLQVGSNQITIRVYNSDKSSSKDYVLNIKRLEEREQLYTIDDDSSLSSLIISNHVLKFSKDVLEYDVELDDNETSIDLIANSYGPNATVSVSNTDNLKNGSKVLVIVTSYSKKNKTTYTINIKKSEAVTSSTKYFIIGGVIIILIFVSYIVQKIRLKQIAKDPILNIKNQKRLINKGIKLDTSNIPETEVPGSAINLNKEPDKTIVIQTEKVEDTNLNKITDNRTVLDLSSAKIVSNDNQNSSEKTPTYIVSDEEEIEILDD